MASFEIHGGKPLKGELHPQGAKMKRFKCYAPPY